MKIAKNVFVYHQKNSIFKSSFFLANKAFNRIEKRNFEFEIILCPKKVYAIVLYEKAMQKIVFSTK